MRSQSLQKRLNKAIDSNPGCGKAGAENFRHPEYCARD
jgi:hypothetical protein